MSDKIIDLEASEYNEKKPRLQMERNETNQNSQGGTERVVQGLYDRVDPDLLEKFQIIPSRVRELKEDKIRVYWIHDLAQDPETNHLKEEESRNRFHKIVFCSNWQFQQYVNFVGMPLDQRSCVIETPIVPFEPLKAKSKKEIRLVYTSTPQRGLEILVPVFEKLCETHDNIVLDVFSSFSIYGWPDSDKPFEALFDRCKAHPKINYHGFQPNDVVRKALTKAHIFAYPSIWLECNSQSLIEAMSAGLLCVHPNYGGLADTSGGLTAMYQMDANHNNHAQMFYNILDQAIQNVNTEDTQNYMKFVKAYADTRYNWTKIQRQWEALLASLNQTVTPELLGLPKKSEKQYFTFRTPG